MKTVFPILIILIATVTAHLVGNPESVSVSAEQQETRNAQIIYQPPPMKVKGKGADFEGSVVLRMIFRVSGRVTDIEVVEVTPKGLPEEVTKEWVKLSTKAAKKIKFKPALKDGRPMSQHVKIEFNFNLSEESHSSMNEEKPNNAIHPTRIQR
ncbi:MAG TPA: energy transducer TonB [Pyrinomonadaceae bacterium]|nr:energy transducer TonB [Pyrinomonadaceae bacterium]